MEHNMSRFTIKDGNFWLDDTPQMIQAGEFHYYRTPRDQWRSRLELLKNAGFNALASYIPWLWHQLEEDVSDFDGHSHPMRDLAGFLDLAAEMGLLIIARPGPYIMAETINEGIPPWVFKNYPRVAFIDQNGKAQNIVSYLHPDFLACVSKWYKAIFEVLSPRQITRNGRIIMIQLDNEMGMMKWVRNIMDTNSHTISMFAAFLSREYGMDISRLYPLGDMEYFLREGILHPNETYGLRIVEDYRRFYRDYLGQYAAFLASEAKANGMETLPVINIHGFANGGKTFPIGLSQLLTIMSMDEMVSATDVYPGHIGEGNYHQLLLVNEMTKSLHNKQQALFSVEFQAGGNQDFGNGQASLFDLHSRLCISSGMRAINHYLFFDGENDPVLSPVKRHDWGHPVRKDGSLRSHYHRYPKLSRVLQAYGTDLVLSRPKTVTTIGFLIDYFMTEVNNRFSKKSTDILTHQRDDILFDMIARGLSLTHRPFNTLELSRDYLDPARNPLCWVMMEKQCNADTQQKLVDYVKNGGRLILAGRLCLEDFHHHECTILRDALGIHQSNTHEPFVTHNITIFKYQDVPVSFLETYTGEFDEVFASSETQEIVGFIKNLGKGRLMMFGAAMTANTLDDLDVVHQMALKMESPPLFHAEPWVDVRISDGANGSFLFINNYQDDPVETKIEYNNQALFGGNPVNLPARRGSILPIDWSPRKGITVHYVTSEIIEILDNGVELILKTDQDEFFAELTLEDYECDAGIILEIIPGRKRIKLHGTEGLIVLIIST